jgi:hypothetical protein
MTSAQKAISSISTAGKRQSKAFVQRIDVVATADNYSGTQDVEAAAHSTGQNPQMVQNKRPL